MTDVGVPLDRLGPYCPRCQGHHPATMFPCRRVTSLEQLRTTATVLRGAATASDTDD